MAATIVEALAGASSAGRSPLRRHGAPRAGAWRAASAPGAGSMTDVGRVLRRELQRDHDRDRGSVRHAALDRALAAESPRALAHAEDAERGAARADLGQADAIVGDLEPEMAVIEPERDVDPLGGGVAGDVGEGFLEDPEHVGRQAALELEVA